MASFVSHISFHCSRYTLDASHFTLARTSFSEYLLCCQWYPFRGECGRVELSHLCSNQLSLLANVDKPIWVDTYYAVRVFFREKLHWVELFHFFSDEPPTFCHCLHNPGLTCCFTGVFLRSGINMVHCHTALQHTMYTPGCQNAVTTYICNSFLCPSAYIIHPIFFALTLYESSLVSKFCFDHKGKNTIFIICCPVPIISSRLWIMSGGSVSKGWRKKIPDSVFCFIHLIKTVFPLSVVFVFTDIVSFLLFWQCLSMMSLLFCYFPYADNCLLLKVRGDVTW